MALKVLIADPDSKESEHLKSCLEKNFYVVSTCSNGKECQLKLYQDEYYALVLNWDTADHSAQQVLLFTKKNYPRLKTIVVVNDSKIYESGDVSVDSIMKLGAYSVLTKFFEIEDLLNTLDSNSSQRIASAPLRDGVSAEIEVQGDDFDYTPIPIGDFYSSKAVLFDIFIKIANQRYIKILHAGDSFSNERIKKYKEEKKVEYLYFHKKDRKQFIHFNNMLLKRTIPNNKIAAKTKANIIQNLATKYIDEVHLNGLKPQIIEQGKEICDSIFQFIEKEKELYKLLKDFQDFDPHAFTHSALVTLYVTAITKQFDWQSAQTMQSMAMACLFHDIGKSKLPKELLDMTMENMSEDQLKIYKEHPLYGFEILDQNKMINNTVKQVVLQHHETYDGLGYPYGIKGSRILLMANIVCLVDDFIDIMLKQKKAPVDALRSILVDKVQVAKYHSSIIENFIKVFVDPEKMPKDLKSHRIERKAS